MLCYSDTVVGNHDVKAVPVGVNQVGYAEPAVLNHGVLCWANSCETL